MRVRFLLLHFICMFHCFLHASNGQGFALEIHELDCQQGYFKLKDVIKGVDRSKFHEFEIFLHKNALYEFLDKQSPLSLYELPLGSSSENIDANKGVIELQDKIAIKKDKLVLLLGLATRKKIYDLLLQNDKVLLSSSILCDFDTLLEQKFQTCNDETSVVFCSVCKNLHQTPSGETCNFQ